MFWEESSNRGLKHSVDCESCDMKLLPSNVHAVLSVVLSGIVCAVTQASGDSVVVKNPRQLRVDRLPAQRIALGRSGDYKPCLARLPDGQLLIIAFHSELTEDRKGRENIILFRSGDGGEKWSEASPVPVLGREAYITVLKSGVLLMTSLVLANDIRNTEGCTYSQLSRSTDNGIFWETVRVGPDGFPSRAIIVTSRNILALSDGTLLLGVSALSGFDYVWRSFDDGKTWDKSTKVDSRSIGVDTKSRRFFAEAFLWETKSRGIVTISRIASRDYPPLDERPIPAAKWDQTDRMSLWHSSDLGHSWQDRKNFGDYGEMYPSVLRLKDGRLLLTFTVRDLKPQLGIQAVLGKEERDTLVFDFDHDRLILESRTPSGSVSGGGFGPTVQLADGTLVTSYSYRGTDQQTHLEVVRWRLP